MSVVGSDEDHVTAVGYLTGDLEPGEAGHLDVEKDDVRHQPSEQFQRLEAVAGLADDLELGPERGEMRAQLVAQHAFVFGDDSGRVGHGGS
jgi:hypothetical protein